MIRLYCSVEPTLYCSLTSMPTGFNPVVDLLTVPEVAKLLKISTSGVRHLQQQRVIPFIKVGGSVRFDRRDIASYLERNRVNAIGQ